MSIASSFRLTVAPVALLVLLFACAEWKYPHGFPLLSTEAVENVNPGSVELTGIIESLGESPVVRYGFVWGEQGQPTIDAAVLVVGGEVSKGRYSAILTNDLRVQVEYHVRAFIQTDTQVIYGNEVTFISQGTLAPAIAGFIPTEGVDGTEITISGTNFGTTNQINFVTIGNLNCDVISATATELKIISPPTMLVGEFKISVIVDGQTTVSSTNYSILGPRIRTTSTLTGRVGDVVTMGGEYFNTSYTAINFGFPNSFNQSITNVLSSTQLTCIVPDVSATGQQIYVQAELNGQMKRFAYPPLFTVIDSRAQISPTTPLPSGIVPTNGQVSVIINDLIYVVWGRKLFEYNTTSGVWAQRADFPGPYRFFATGFTYSGKIYYGFGEGYNEPSGINGQYYNDLWSYNPANNTWALYLTSPLNARSRMVSFVIGNKAYLGFGWVQSPAVASFNDFWSLDLISNQWTSVSEPFNAHAVGASAFAVNNKGYIVGIERSGGCCQNPYADFWEFDPVGSTWTAKSDYPNASTGQVATTRNSNGLVPSSGKLYEYDPATNTWVKRQGLPFILHFSHYRNSKLYYAPTGVWTLSFD